MSTSTCLCLISFFLKFQNLLFEILENITSCLGIYKYQSYHEFLENLKKWNQTKTWYLLTLFILVWFTHHVTHQKRREKIQTGENHVHQGFSKVFVFYTYFSSLQDIYAITLVGSMKRKLQRKLVPRTSQQGKTSHN